MGTQTGVSLYAPSTGASLVSLRGTDGISSGSGVMPLTYLQDFEGPIARTTSDIARILNVTTGTDPGDPATVHADADAKRPADWKAALDPNALEGKKIGYIPASFQDNLSYGQNDGTAAAVEARFTDLEAAGATMVPITTPTPASIPAPSLGGRSRTEEGWQHYWGQQVDPPFTTASGPTGILTSPKVLPYNRQTGATAPARLTTADVDGIMANRDANKAAWKEWMDDAGVDAVVYPGFRSDVYDNDGAQTLSSDRGTNVPTSNIGLPTLILPVGRNPHGDPISIQIVGRAFDDEKVLGFGFALEQQLGGRGHQLSPMAPKLAYDASATPSPVDIPVPPAPITSSAYEAPTETATTPEAAAGSEAASGDAAPAAPAAPTTVPTPAASGPAKLSIRLPKAATLHGSRLTVRVANTGKTTVSGTVTLKRTVRVHGKLRTQVVGTAKVTVAAGATKTITVSIRPGARAAFRGGKQVKLTAQFTLKVPGGSRTTKSTTVTVGH
jgi:amidase